MLSFKRHGRSLVDAINRAPLSPPEPVTRILAIGTVNPGVDPAAVRAILPAEIKATVALYLTGRIDQWFSLRDRNGVVFILNGHRF